MSFDVIVNIAYIVCAFLFIAGLKMMSSPQKARQGNVVSASGMLAAIVLTLLDRQILTYQWIAAGLAAGTVAGVFLARIVKMTEMPQMVALLNGFGGLASLLVGWVEFHNHPTAELFKGSTTLLSILIGGVTFSGSMAAWTKLAGYLKGKAIQFTGQGLITLCIALATVATMVLSLAVPQQGYAFFLATIVLSLILGILVTIPIGGADMPVVISLLNSYSGMAACAVGFVLLNNLLIVTGALVGASGIILTNIMCKAMNRSLVNVLFGAIQARTSKTQEGPRVEGEEKPITVEDAYYILEASRSAVFVPGYGMAVAQAQHAVKELAGILEDNGCEVKFAIHPVAGRMPGHMNVLLAEAGVPYEKLVEMDAINPIMEIMDVCIVIGANDVVNPAARTQKGSPIYGMPIIDADKAGTVFVLKRTMAAGFSGVDNPLFYNEKTRMLFGHAKSTIEALVAQFKGHL